MTGPAPDPARARAAMVADQLRTRDVSDERVLAAMGAVPREAFVPEVNRRDAYADEALPIEAGQTISQPLMVAKMTEHLGVLPGDRILEIGTGSGYQAAYPTATRSRPTHACPICSFNQTRRRCRSSAALCLCRRCFAR